MTLRALAAGFIGMLLCLSACGGGAAGAAPPAPPATVPIALASAAWLNRSTISWPGTGASAHYTLYYAAAGGMALDASGQVHGADGSYVLTAGGTLTPALAAAYPLWSGATILTLPSAAQSAAGNLLRGQLLVVAVDTGSVQGTQLQVQGVLDDLYAARAQAQTLGVSIAADGTPTLRLWAPTALSVALTVGGADTPMSLDAASGVWSLTGPSSWTNSAYYTYKVQVYARTDGGVVKTYVVTDPYAVSLNAAVFGGAPQQALVADLSAAALAPSTWAADAAPALAGPQDIVLYELHVRDFSDNDASLANAALAGKFEAFTDAASAGMQHLAAMAAAGVTHVHLLPAFDIASINEGGCTTPLITNTGPGAATATGPQAQVGATQSTDCYNWGYDPRHYGAPAGTYATNAADATVRVREFRDMVAALHRAGLRVVMDVVYNHTSSNFLDQIVPGYYYRLDRNGAIENYSCCADTATEFAMAAKLMSDTLVRWAMQYHVDGFRFDIMSFTPKAQLLAARTAVDAAVAASGRGPLYYYGEGWNSGGADVANDARFVMARQANLAGTGVGSFNDRLRDAVRGGGPLDAGASLLARQGFASGLCYDANAASACPAGEPAYSQNLIRIGMAGSLAAFVLDGQAASTYDYGGQAAGYTGLPTESINYAGVHDNETLWDISQYKHPATTASADRARAQVVALAPVLLGQGVPFLHAGDELLRSKAMDRNSFDSGDWFNRIDWSASTNYFATMGLPLASQNQSNWPTMTPVLQNPNAAPGAADIVFARETVKDLLRVRRSTSMLRLGSAAAVLSCVSFPDQAAQLPGFVMMRIGNGATPCGDNRYKSVVVAINANKVAQSYVVAGYVGHASVALHPQQLAGYDPVVKAATFDATTGSFTVPARSVAVFVEP